MKIALLSNININMISEKISSDEIETYHSDGYNMWMQEVIQSNSNLYNFAPNTIYCLLDGFELFKNIDLQQSYNLIEEYLGYVEVAVKQNPNIYYFISDLDILPKKLQALKKYRIEREIELAWYKGLSMLCNQYKNLYVFALKELIEEMGRATFYSNKMWYLASSRYSIKGEKRIIQAIKQTLNAIQGKRKKCLILDLDNTLWGGVIGEDGIDGIALSENKEGARYKDFQKRIKDIKNTGIILAIVSKNNYEDAMEVMGNHPDMVLKPKDFVATKINWNIKSQNIKELSEELDIGKDSFVLIDDNPVEREMVKNELPEVTVVDFPKDTCTLENFITEVYYQYFLIPELTTEDLKKTEMYEKNYKRSEVKKQYQTVDDYLLSLQTKICIKEVGIDDVARVAQLCQKTNQFNLTTKRYTEADIIQMINDEKYIIYIASVEDKFGDSGKCVLIIIEKIDKRIADIDSFIMSCRVMGRYIEDIIITHLENRLKKAGYEKITAHYYPTKKNIPVKNLFERLGYNVINNGDYKDYAMNLTHIEASNRKELAEVIEI